MARPQNLHLGQNALVEILLEELTAHPHASVLWNHEFRSLEQDGDTVTAVFRTPGGEAVHRDDWLIGADGARSAVRTALGIPFEGCTWPERLVATNVRYPFQELGFAQATFVIDDIHRAVIAKLHELRSPGLWRYTCCEDASLPEDGSSSACPGSCASSCPTSTAASWWRSPRTGCTSGGDDLPRQAGAAGQRRRARD